MFGGGGSSWHRPCVISCSNGCTFLPTDEIFSVISGCQQNADGNKPATMFLLLLKQQTGHLCRCTWGITWSWDFGQIAHWSHVNIAHHQIVPPGSSQANQTHARQRRAAGPLGYRLSSDENTPKISLWYLPRIYPPLTSTSGRSYTSQERRQRLGNGSGF